MTASMLVAVVDIRIMGMRVFKRLVHMRMRMRLAAIPVARVSVLVMRVMAVRVFV